ncbi:MAG: hypothetical protein U0793_11545 [Gemmataceae bacterium]
MNNPGATEKTAIDAGHETTDVSVTGLWKFGVYTLIAAFAIHFGVAWLYWVMADASSAAQKPMNPRLARERIYLPEDLKRIPAPRLQENETADLDRLRLQEEAKLRHIQEAMNLLADPKTAARYGVTARPGGK